MRTYLNPILTNIHVCSPLSFNWVLKMRREGETDADVMAFLRQTASLTTYEREVILAASVDELEAVVM